MWIQLDNKYSFDTAFVVPRQISVEVADALPDKDERTQTGQVIVDGKILNIEIDIIPVVNYLNSFDDITTVSSCNGHEFYRTGTFVWRSKFPWVGFECSNLALIESLVLTFNPKGLPEHVDMVFLKKNLWLLKFIHIVALNNTISRDFLQKWR